jgi:hypothetical protein
MILETIITQKRFFNVKSAADVKLAKKFFATHHWGSKPCPFILEYPYLTIPDMIKDKLIHKQLGIHYNRKHHWIGV